MDEEGILKIQSQAGIKRDGTLLDGDYYTDGEWVRFQGARPRKIGGYRSLNKTVDGLVNSLHGYTKDQLTYVHAGSPNLVERFFVDASLGMSTINDRTPTSGFTADDSNMWTFSAVYKSTATAGMNLLAAVAPNAGCICNSEGGEYFTGPLFGTTALTAVTLPSGWNCTGGVMAVGPYAVLFGNDGFVGWSVPNDPTDLANSGSGSAYVTHQKIVAGLPLRGGPSTSPSALLWSADSLLQMSFTGGSSVWTFNTLSSETSILSSNCVVEFDGVFYWVGTDHFMMFNGVVRELPNNLNFDFFFDNLNSAHRQAVFAFKVPRYGEIWWCFPKGNSTVPNHAVIYNTRENTWYDTPLPNSGRSAGLSPSIFSKPLLSGVVQQDYRATEVAIDGGGTGYTAGDILTVSDGTRTVPVELTVDTVSAGVITAVSISNEGRYTSVPANAVAVTGGTGNDDATFDITWAQPYKIWAHESGYDQIDDGYVNPIVSYIDSSVFCLPLLQGKDRSLHISLVEPDFVQTGPLDISILGRVNARADDVQSAISTIPETPSNKDEQLSYFKVRNRLIRFRVESNSLGGNFEMGLPLAHIQEADGRVTQ